MTKFVKRCEIILGLRSADCEVDTEEDIEWEDFTDIMRRLYKYTMDEKISSDRNIKAFVELSMDISSLLPKVSDTSLFEIDDLFHPDAGVTEMKVSGSCIPESWEIDKWIFLYFQSDFETHSCLMETIFLQIIEHSSTKTWIFYDAYSLLIIFLSEQLHSGKESRICLAIKVLKVFVFRHGEEIVKYSAKEHFELLIIRMLKLKNIPEINHPDKARFTSWVSTQSSIIHKKVVQICQTNSIDLKVLGMYELLQTDMEDHLLYEMFHEISSTMDVYPKVWLEFFYKFFTTAKDDEERLKRMKMFVSELYGNVTEKPEDKDLMLENAHNFIVVGVQGSALHSMELDGPKSKLAWGVSVNNIFNAMFQMMYDARNDEAKLKRVKEFIENFVNFHPSGDSIIESIVYECVSKIVFVMKYNCYTNNQLRQTDIIHKYEIKPYLSEDSNVADQVDLGIGKLQIFSDEMKASRDCGFVMEKYFFYDNFMRNIHLLSIIHTALLKGQQCNWANIKRGDVSKIFMIKDKYLIKIISDAKKDMSKSWFIETLQKYCSFLKCKTETIDDIFQ